MRGTELIRQQPEVLPVHGRSLEHLARLWKVLGRHTQVTKYLVCKALGKFVIKTFDQSHALIAIDIAGANFLSSIIAGTSNSKFDAGGVIVKIVDAIIDAVVLAVGTGCSLGRGLKSAVFDRVVVTALRMPPEVISQVMHFHILFCKPVGISRQVGLQIVLVYSKPGPQIVQRNTAEKNLGLVRAGKIGPVSLCTIGITAWIAT